MRKNTMFVPSSKRISATLPRVYVINNYIADTYLRHMLARCLLFIGPAPCGPLIPHIFSYRAPRTGVG